jgi:hypothetical protein
MPGRLNTYTGLTDARAECDDCDFHVVSRNSLGLAAQHADRHPDHTVRAEQIISVLYNKKNDVAGN